MGERLTEAELCEMRTVAEQHRASMRDPCATAVDRERDRLLYVGHTEATDVLRLLDERDALAADIERREQAMVALKDELNQQIAARETLDGWVEKLTAECARLSESLDRQLVATEKAEADAGRLRVERDRKRADFERLVTVALPLWSRREQRGVDARREFLQAELAQVDSFLKTLPGLRTLEDLRPDADAAQTCPPCTGACMWMRDGESCPNYPEAAEARERELATTLFRTVDDDRHDIEETDPYHAVAEDEEPDSAPARMQPGGMVVSDAMFAGLDPGIRKTVDLLVSLGFDTTDSGDGKTKIAAGFDSALVLECPHVIMVSTKDTMIADADRLSSELRARGINPRIEASYSPDDGAAVLMLWDVEDEALAAAAKEGS